MVTQATSLYHNTMCMHTIKMQGGWEEKERSRKQANYSVRVSPQIVSKHNDKQERIKSFHAGVSPFILNGCHKFPARSFPSEPESNGPRNFAADSKKGHI